MADVTKSVTDTLSLRVRVLDQGWPLRTTTATDLTGKKIGYLIELDSSWQPVVWDQASGGSFDSTTIFFDSTTITFALTGVFTADLDPLVRLVRQVTYDGQPLAESGSLADLQAYAGHWYADIPSGVFWIHTPDDLTPVGHVIALTLTRTLRFGPLAEVGRAPIWERRGQPTVWEGRVLSMPESSLSLGPDTIPGAGSSGGSGGVAGLGELRCSNLDGWGDRILAAENLQGQEVRIYRKNVGEAEQFIESATLWAVGIVDQVNTTPEEIRLGLTTRTAFLDQPLLNRTYTVDTGPPNLLQVLYPRMWAAMVGELGEGTPIPRVWGQVIGAISTCIDYDVGNLGTTSRWKVADHAVVSIVNARSQGVNWTITATYLDLGEFDLSILARTGEFIFVDVEGLDVGANPGTLMYDLAVLGGWPPAMIDVDAIALLNAERPVRVAMQRTGGTIREALDAVAASVFADWWVSRTGILMMRARKRDAGNLVQNPALEVDTTNWDVVGANLAIARSTAQHARGVASLEITKSAAALTANNWVRARLDPVAPELKLIGISMLVANQGHSQGFQVGLANNAGSTFVLSDEVLPLAQGRWVRVEAIVTAPATVTTALRRLVVIPQQAPNTDAVVLYLDEVEAVQVLRVFDGNAEVLDLQVAPVILRHVRVRYAYNAHAAAFNGDVTGSTNIGQYAVAGAMPVNTVTGVVPSATSDVVEGFLEAKEDAEVVAAAILDYFGVPRLRARLRLLNVGSEVVTIGTGLWVTHSRVPIPPAGSHIFRVIEMTESQPGPGSVPSVEVVAESVLDTALGSSMF